MSADELKSEILASQHNEKMSNRLAEIATELFWSVTGDFKTDAKEEALQEYLLTIIVNLPEIDVSQDCGQQLVAMSKQAMKKENFAQQYKPKAFSQYFSSAFAREDTFKVEDLAERKPDAIAPVEVTY